MHSVHKNFKMITTPVIDLPLRNKDKYLRLKGDLTWWITYPSSMTV